MVKRNNKLEKAMLGIRPTETPLRMWERRFIVALTDEAKQQCKNMIKKYK